MKEKVRRKGKQKNVPMQNLSNLSSIYDKENPKQSLFSFRLFHTQKTTSGFAFFSYKGR